MGIESLKQKEGSPRADFYSAAEDLRQSAKALGELTVPPETIVTLTRKIEDLYATTF